MNRGIFFIYHSICHALIELDNEVQQGW